MARPDQREQWGYYRSVAHFISTLDTEVENSISLEESVRNPKPEDGNGSDPYMERSTSIDDDEFPVDETP